MSRNNLPSYQQIQEALDTIEMLTVRARAARPEARVITSRPPKLVAAVQEMLLNGPGLLSELSLAPDLWSYKGPERADVACLVYGFVPVPGAKEWVYGRVDNGIVCIRVDGGMLAPVPILMSYAVVDGASDNTISTLSWPSYTDWNLIGEGTLRSMLRRADRDLGTHMMGDIFAVSRHPSHEGYYVNWYPDSLTHAAWVHYWDYESLILDLSKTPQVPGRNNGI